MCKALYILKLWSLAKRWACRGRKVGGGRDGGRMGGTEGEREGEVKEERKTERKECISKLRPFNQIATFKN